MCVYLFNPLILVSPGPLQQPELPQEWAEMITETACWECKITGTRDKSDLRGIMQIPGPEGFIQRAEAGMEEEEEGGKSWPLCTPLFIK